MSIARRITQWKNSDVAVVLKNSRRVYSGIEFDIRLAKTTNVVGRLLLIVPRKTGTAPKRNQFKRRMKSIFYQEKLFTTGYDWIVFAKEAGTNASFDALKQILTNTQQIP